MLLGFIILAYAHHVDTGHSQILGYIAGFGSIFLAIMNEGEQNK